MAEESLTLAIDLGARDPCRIVAAARKLQYPPQVIQLLSRLGFVVAVELNVDTDLGVFVERRQRGERGRLLTLTTQDIQRPHRNIRWQPRGTGRDVQNR